MAVGMGFAVSAKVDTEQKTKQSAILSSKLDKERELAEATQRAAKAREGPRSINTGLKQKLDTPLVDVPRFRRHYVWSNSTNKHLSPAALYTEVAPPLPSPPTHLLHDPKIQATLLAMRNHIKVETPFNVDKLESMLADHPNQPFVQSVMTGLREGFWPLDDGDWKIELEEVIDNYSTDEGDLDAIRAFRDKERSAGCWSDDLSRSELLPGMKISPMFVVWQNGKARVVTDHSGSGINDGIPKSEAKVRYDDMHPFGQALRDAQKDNPGRRIVTFKSDVASAFLNLPAHPLWQLRQVVVVEGKLYIVRHLVFGNRASPRCWCAVSGLLCWLAIRKLGILSLHVYMDDFFGWDFEDNLIMYHGKLRPRQQVQLLLFWEAIQCPFEDKKQEHGNPLKIIGFWVDANQGSLSLPPSSLVDIVDKIKAFLATPNRKPTLREWQRLAGHLNWLLNVLPWARPALTALYHKTSGKTRPLGAVHLNAEVTSDLTWLSSIIPRSVGVRFLDDGIWDDSAADLEVWTDASLTLGMSFVYGNQGFMYGLKECPPGLKIDIFFLELVAIMSAIHHVASFPSPPHRLLIHTDSLDSVSVFNTLRVSEALHNGPLMAVAGIIIRSGIDLRIRHIPGKLNIRADLLSRLLLDEYRAKFPLDRVRLFSPPRDLLPARWRGCF